MREHFFYPPDTETIFKECKLTAFEDAYKRLPTKLKSKKSFSKNRWALRNKWWTMINEQWTITDLVKVMDNLLSQKKWMHSQTKVHEGKFGRKIWCKNDYFPGIASKVIDEKGDRRSGEIIILLETFHKTMNLIGCIGVFMDNQTFQKHLSKFMTKMLFSIWCKVKHMQEF